MKKNSSILINKSTISSIALGGFDGMHLAHQKLFSHLNSNGAIICIDSGHASLTPKENRQDHSSYPVIFYALEDIKHLSGENFIKLLNKEFPNLKKIIVGFDFCFGKNRKYSTNDLKIFFKKEVIVVKEICFNNIAVHSRIIRQYLKQGDIKTANDFLDYSYAIKGKHIKGQGLGKKSFVPTINVDLEKFLIPQEGVYITQTIINSKEYDSISFLGKRLSTNNNFAIETHILDNYEDNIHEIVQIKFYEKLRDNKKFNTFEELKEQILLDIKKTKLYFLKNRKK